EALVADPDSAGYLVPQPMRGGEVKQFVRGGTAISIVGAVDGSLPDSVVQDLGSTELTQITRTPGYDETTIFSPDEKLGVVMSSRASEGTDLAVLGLLPRPHAALTGMGLAWATYAYTVTGVRQWRRGNVGPVLINIERSQNEPGYQGVPLNSPDDSWVYISPMSWHPDGRRVLWPEMLRGSDQPGRLRQVRLRRAELLDHCPHPAVPVQPTPAEIPYALDGADAERALRRQGSPVGPGRARPPPLRPGRPPRSPPPPVARTRSGQPPPSVRCAGRPVPWSPAASRGETRGTWSTNAGRRKVRPVVP